jgi:hypothetical protein
MKIGVRPQASGFSKKQNQSGAGFQPARLNRPKADSSKKPPRAAALPYLLAIFASLRETFSFLVVADRPWGVTMKVRV